jgi:hypothetical protein
MSGSGQAPSALPARRFTGGPAVTRSATWSGGARVDRAAPCCRSARLEALTVCTGRARASPSLKAWGYGALAIAIGRVSRGPACGCTCPFREVALKSARSCPRYYACSCASVARVRAPCRRRVASCRRPSGRDAGGRRSGGAQAHGRDRCRRGAAYCRGARGSRGTPARWNWMCRATAWPTTCCATRTSRQRLVSRCSAR